MNLSIMSMYDDNYLACSQPSVIIPVPAAAAAAAAWPAAVCERWQLLPAE